MANTNKKRDVYGRVVNGLCLETNGHDYRATVSPFYQRCCRTGCTVTQRLCNGVWVEVFPNTATPTHEQSPQEPTHTLMDECVAPITVRIESVLPSLISDSVKTWWLH